MPIQKQPVCRKHKTIGGKEQLIFENATGQRITRSGGGASVVVKDGIGNSVVFNGASVTVRAVGKIVLQASIVEIDASQVSLNAASVTCTGIFQANMVTANTVSAGTYTPGRETYGNRGLTFVRPPPALH